MRKITAARARKIDLVVATKLDRLARSTHQLISLGKELEALGVDLVIGQRKGLAERPPFGVLSRP
jgi:DNA invertase Pin-like site-specific DNA recombinase